MFRICVDSPRNKFRPHYISVDLDLVRSLVLFFPKMGELTCSTIRDDVCRVGDGDGD